MPCLQPDPRARVEMPVELQVDLRLPTLSTFSRRHVITANIYDTQVVSMRVSLSFNNDSLADLFACRERIGGQSNLGSLFLQLLGRLKDILRREYPGPATL